MLVIKDPIGPDNDQALMDMAEYAQVIVAAWGIHGTHLGQDCKVRRMIPNLNYLKLTKKGFPGHPLYLPKKLRPVPWNELLTKG